MCGPSRSSLFTGLAPTTTNIRTNERQPRICTARTRLASRGRTLRTLNEVFLEAGYETRGSGKLYHNDEGRGSCCGSELARARWTDRADIAFVGGRHSVAPDLQSVERLARVPVYQFADVAREDEDRLYIDANITAHAVQEIEALASPWVYMYGLHKPHLPYFAPKRFRDMLAGGRITPPTTRLRDRRLRDFRARWREDSQYKARLPKHDFDEMRLAYFATVAFADELIGRVLAAAGENTTVVFLSDHGFHAGEHGFWAKHTLLDGSVRVPLMIRDPRFAPRVSDAPVELLDVFPTAMDLAGIAPLPRMQDLDGVSLRPIMDGTKTFVKPVARSWWHIGPRRFSSVRGTRFRVVSVGSRRRVLDYKPHPREDRDISRSRTGRRYSWRLRRARGGADPPDAHLGAHYVRPYDMKF